MIWFVLSLLGLALVALASVGLLYGERQRQARLEERADHAKCIAHIASVTSNQFVAARLRDLADRWDSIEEQSNLRQLARENYMPGGPSMPVIWMYQQADRLVARLPDEEAIFNLNGERVL